MYKLATEYKAKNFPEFAVLYEPVLTELNIGQFKANRVLSTFDWYINIIL